MEVDVVTAVEIARPRDEVAAFATDPENVTRWYQNIRSVEWETDPAVEVGSRMAFVAPYTWHDLPSGGTSMTLRNRGEPSGSPGSQRPR